MLSNRLRAFLERNAIDYEVVQHKPDFTAQETAADTGTPGRCFAKAVVLQADGECALAVLPAPARLDMAKARSALNARNVHLAAEERMRELFPDCDLGAEPPFGNLYDLPVYVDPSLARAEEITFNAGDHETALRMRFADFARLSKAREAPLAAAD